MHYTKYHLSSPSCGFGLDVIPRSEVGRAFIDGTRHVITMCLIFVLAGAFSTVAKDIGGVSVTVSILLKVLPDSVLLVSLFLASSLISFAVGTSMGVIATMGSIAPLG